MTATEELRRMLDERDILWCSSSEGKRTITWLPLENKKRLQAVWQFCDCGDGEVIVFTSFYNNVPGAIEAAVGRGMCKDTSSRFNAWQCSECGATLLLMFDDYDEPTYSVDGKADVPRYCPNCGREVDQVLRLGDVAEHQETASLADLFGIWSDTE